MTFGGGGIVGVLVALAALKLLVLGLCAALAFTLLRRRRHGMSPRAYRAWQACLGAFFLLVAAASALVLG